MPLPVAITMMLMMTHKSLATGSSCLRTHGSLFDPSQHHALTGHSFLNQSGTVRSQCMMLCVRHRLCLSFNHNDISGMCQLNDARKEEFTESYKQDDGFSYFGRLVSRAYGVVETTTEAEKQSDCVTEPSESPTQDSQGSEWQMVFKGVAWRGTKLYDLWTNTTRDSVSGDKGNYRNEMLYKCWNNGQLNIKRVKLSLYDDTDESIHELVFNGTDSNILSWFAKERLVSSPWSDLTATATTSHFSTSVVHASSNSRRFYITKSHGGCLVDTGWLLVRDTAGFCSWERSDSSYPIIQYSKNTAVNFDDARKAGTLGIADYLTIHINTE